MEILKKIIARNNDPFGSEQVTIVCLGDSVTQGGFRSYVDHLGRGTGDCLPGLAYPRKLEDELWFLFPHATVNVINSGIGGDNSRGMLARFDRDVARYKPDLVTILMGQNDCCGLQEDIETKLAEASQNFGALFKKVLDIGAECIYVTPWMTCTYVDPSVAKSAFAEVAQDAAERQKAGLPDRFINVARRLADEMGIPVADAYSEWKLYADCEINTTELLANRINHPIPKMHDIFVRKILEKIMS